MRNKYVLQVTYCNDNYGSVLQCFSLQQYFIQKNVACFLVKRKDGMVSRIKNSFIRHWRQIKNYVLYEEFRSTRSKLLKNSELSKNSISNISRTKIEGFVTQHISLKNEPYSNLKKLANSENCILCIAGSDQIWDAYRINVDDTYFLSFAPDNKKVSYAPSFGSDTISSYNRKLYKKLLKKFKLISVRENTGVNIVNQLIGVRPEVLLDPVFLHSKDYWMKMSESIDSKFNDSKFIFAFFLDRPNDIAFSHLKHFEKNGFRLISIGYYESFSELDLNIDIIEGGPLDFVNLISNAYMVFTDSFHATAFSSIFNKNFWTYARTYSGTDQSTRLKDFLTKIGAFYRYQCSDTTFRDFTEEEVNNINNYIKECKLKSDLYFNTFLSRCI